MTRNGGERGGWNPFRKQKKSPTKTLPPEGRAQTDPAKQAIPPLQPTQAPPEDSLIALKGIIPPTESGDNLPNDELGPRRDQFLINRAERLAAEEAERKQQGMQIVTTFPGIPFNLEDPYPVDAFFKSINYRSVIHDETEAIKGYVPGEGSFNLLFDKGYLTVPPEAFQKLKSILRISDDGEGRYEHTYLFGVMLDGTWNAMEFEKKDGKWKIVPCLDPSGAGGKSGVVAAFFQRDTTRSEYEKFSTTKYSLRQSPWSKPSSPDETSG